MAQISDDLSSKISFPDSNFTSSTEKGVNIISTEKEVNIELIQNIRTLNIWTCGNNFEVFNSYMHKKNSDTIKGNLGLVTYPGDVQQFPPLDHILLLVLDLQHYGAVILAW